MGGASWRLVKWVVKWARLVADWVSGWVWRVIGPVGSQVGGANEEW